MKTHALIIAKARPRRSPAKSVGIGVAGVEVVFKGALVIVAMMFSLAVGAQSRSKFYFVGQDGIPVLTTRPQAYRNKADYLPEETAKFTVHFKNGATQPADTVKEEELFYALEYSGRRYLVRKSHVEKIETLSPVTAPTQSGDLATTGDELPEKDSLTPPRIDPKVDSSSQSPAEDSFKETLKKAELGDTDAQFRVGIMYENGTGVPQDSSKAFEWWTKAADKGDARVQYNIGRLYSLGRGVPQDHLEAGEWYGKAAAQGYAAAEYSIGHMNNEGLGVPQDKAKAYEWWTFAAEHGDAYAQHNLGLMCYVGDVVPQDYAKARMWWKMAAEQGDAGSQCNLGVMYGTGEGVSVDYARAYMWFNISIASGQEKASEGLMKVIDGQATTYQQIVENASKALDLVRQAMTPEQIAEGQRLSTRWFEKHNPASKTTP